jgi:hypothetical protein
LPRKIERVGSAQQAFAEAVIRSVVLNVEFRCRLASWPPLGEAISPLRTVVAVVIAACVADCTAERVQIANYAQNKMVGLTKE